MDIRPWRLPLRTLFILVLPFRPLCSLFRHPFCPFDQNDICLATFVPVCQCIDLPSRNEMIGSLIGFQQEQRAHHVCREMLSFDLFEPSAG